MNKRQPNLFPNNMYTHPRANGAERRSGRQPGARELIPPAIYSRGREALAKSKVHQWSRALRYATDYVIQIDTGLLAWHAQLPW
jgi:hypothetical protein